MANKKTRNLFLGILAGLIAYTIIGKLGLYLLHISWPDYAFHSKDKSYTLEMLLSRLFIGILAAIIASIAATKVANDRGKSAWFVGGSSILRWFVHSFNYNSLDRISSLVSFCLFATNNTSHRTKSLFLLQKKIDLLVTTNI